MKRRIAAERAEASPMFVSYFRFRVERLVFSHLRNFSQDFRLEKSHELHLSILNYRLPMAPGLNSV
jgi:hypothetical protein